MGLHKLTAGEGYTYLTRQVAAQDVTDRGRGGLEAYYSEHGETPGVWLGRGLTSLPSFEGGVVTEAQMVALFGHSQHPDAARLEAQLRAAGVPERNIRAATRLGQAFRTPDEVLPFHRELARRYAAWNDREGRPVGAAVPEPVRARLRTELAREGFTTKFGRPPADARELSGFLAKATSGRRMPVAGYDLTFTPVKSVSALWALATPEVAQVIEAAHTAAYTDVLSWLEDAAVCTRVGPGGIRQLPVTGLLAAAFTHRDSRTGDPNLHTHVAISNKVQVADVPQAGSHAGRWLALDGRPLHQLTVAASERYNTRLEALLRDQLGLRFADRPGPAGKRPVREITGLDPRLLTRWSSRRADIVTAQEQLARRFLVEHGRPPTPVEALRLGKQATLATRPAKHGPRSQHSQRTSWRTEALEVLGGEPALQAMLTAIQDRSRRPALARGARQVAAAPDGRWVAAAADEVLATVQAGRATWQPAHVRAEAERYARTAKLPAVLLNETVDRMVTAALAPSRSIRLGPPDESEQREGEPTMLRRPDGSSVYEPVGTARYTSRAVLAAEQQLLAVADLADGRALSREAVGLALAEAAANGRPLNCGQVKLVHQLACSGARVQLALAPAGTGKTTALGVLARAWTEDGGTLLALAPSAAAAAVLRANLAAAGVTAPADTLAKLLSCLPDATPGGAGSGVTSVPMSGATSRDHPYQPRAPRHLTMHKPAGQRGVTPAAAVPGWVHAVGPGTLVLIDEAGMAGTLELTRTVDYVVGRGGSVRLIGDPQQLAAVGAGGLLRDLAHTHPAATLTDVVRFSDPTEGAASLALRAGNPLALGFYLDQHRVHVGDPTTSADQTYTAWSADRAAGRDSLMLAPTRQLATELNQRARTDRLATTSEAERARPEREVALADETAASRGDLVLTRRNDRRLVLSATDWVKNGDRWQITTVLPDGSLHARHTRSRLTVLLPAGYVREHVTLGYASTIHTAQGSTADTCHTLLTGTESRQLLYVALTRGRSTNHVYLATSSDTEADQPVALTPELVRPPSPVAQLEGILARDDAQVSATSTHRQLTDPATQLAAVCGRYLDGLATAAEQHFDDGTLDRLDRTAEWLLPGLTAQPGYPALRGQLALLAVHGQPAEQLLHHAWAERDLTGALDPAAVLAARLPLPPGRGPLPWLPAVPAELRADPTWAAYLHRQQQRTLELCATLAEQTHDWAQDPTTSNDVPGWAHPLTGVSPKLLERLAVFRAGHGVDEHDLRPTGPLQQETASAGVQQALLTALTGHEPERSRRWDALADQLEPWLTGDPHWAAVTRQLDEAAAAGHDASELLRAALHEPLPDEHPAAALHWRLHNNIAGTPVPTVAEAQRVERSECGAAPLIAAADEPATARWADLADRIDRRLAGEPYWRALAAALDRAHVAGYDVTTRLPQVVTADDPLPTDRPGRALHARLIDECAAAITPLPTANRVSNARALAAAVEAAPQERRTAAQRTVGPVRPVDQALPRSEPSRPRPDAPGVGRPGGRRR